MIRALRQKEAAAGLVGLGSIALIAILGALLAPKIGFEQSVDELARANTGTVIGWWAHAARDTLGAASIVAIIALLVGSLLGMGAAAGSPLTEWFLGRAVELFGMLPAVVLVALVEGTHRIPTLTAFVATMAVLRSLEMARVVRGRALQIMAEDFIVAARALGVSRWQLLRRHLLPHIVGPALVSALLSIATVVSLDAALSFLGLHSGEHFPSWGDMLGVAPRRGYWSLSVAAGAGVVATVTACFLLVDAISRKARIRGPQR